MEHRCSRRVPLNINALIYKHGTPVAMGRIKNGSSHGLYVETDYEDVRELQKLELDILLGQRIKGDRRCRISALVVRKSQFGMGLELEVLEDQGARPLRAFIEQRRLDQHRVHRDLLAETAARAAQVSKEPEEPVGYSPARLRRH
ncbi:PilZ domain-containing protein [Marinimicrobium agarilyticum]|uniref:PilZ domain-containing protein n=1 Tax=Marinimicrobium agarilyticum TaxID=306546 RepID=UPI00041B60DD|nr:PilZ domain-containing protein [Marinimicrobium agarilyticum]